MQRVAVHFYGAVEATIRFSKYAYLEYYKIFIESLFLWKNVYFTKTFAFLESVLPHIRR